MLPEFVYRTQDIKPAQDLLCFILPCTAVITALEVLPMLFRQLDQLFPFC